MTPKYYHAYFSKPGTALAQAEAGLLAYLKSLKDSKLSPVKVYVALGAVPSEGLAAYQKHLVQIIGDALAQQTPALTAVVQPPVDHSPLLAEIWCVQGNETCRFHSVEGLPHVLITHKGITELWSSGFVAESAEASFEKLSALLERFGFTYDDIFRQWNYVGHILEENVINGKKVQNYQYFNDIRAVYYQRKQNRKQYPAATGIGMDFPGTCLDFVAVKAAPGVSVRNLPIRSAVQTDAYRYQDHVLVGESVVLAAKNAPLFERGRCLLSENGGIAMISGTASIKGEETVDLNDIRRQTANTLRFIGDLLEKTPSARCRRARLYVKRGQDPQEAVRIFRQAYPEDCVCTAVFADICRNNLLIEIETDWEL